MSELGLPKRGILLWAKAGIFLLALAPAFWLLGQGLGDRLGANPVEAMTRFTGDWTLRLLLVTLAVTPLRRVTGWQPLLRFRRMLGLFAFFYGSLHILTYLWLDQWFNGAAILDDIAHRPYITVGMAAFLLMVPLAVTSTRGMMRRLGSRWQRLHRSVYLIGVLGVMHYLWQVKADPTDPLLYAFLLVLLLALRLPWSWLDLVRSRMGEGRRASQSVSEAGSP